MSQDTYSTYEAKAHLSELLRKVREGRVVTITYRGEPVAEVRPISPSPTDLEDQLQKLADQGVLKRTKSVAWGLKTVADQPGALERFLQDRD